MDPHQNLISEAKQKCNAQKLKLEILKSNNKSFKIIFTRSTGLPLAVTSV